MDGQQLHLLILLSALLTVFVFLIVVLLKLKEARHKIKIMQVEFELKRKAMIDEYKKKLDEVSFETLINAINNDIDL